MRSRARSARSVSDCELTETYSPVAIDMAPATNPATPATRTAFFVTAAAATPTIKLAVERIPSLAPRTAARSHPIRVKRGLEPSLARKVAEQLMAKDALTTHAREELGISEITTARPVQAALTSALTFSVGAALPLLMVVISPIGAIVPIVAAASLGFLAFLGAIGARAGGANVLRAMVRVTFWGASAMALTAGIGKVFGTVV